MKSLTQYIDLYREHCGKVNAGSSEALNAARDGALSALEAFRETEQSHVHYKELSADSLLAPDYGLNITRMFFPTDLAATFRCDIPNLSTLLAVVVNDIYRPTALLEKNLPQGVKVMSLARAAQENPQWVSEYYNRLADNCTPAAALNTLFCQDGVLVHIESGVHLEKPLQIVNISNATAEMMSVRRLLVVAEPHSSISILNCDHTQSDDRCLNCQVTEIYAHRGAKVELYGIEEASAQTRRLCNTFVRQDSDSTVYLHESTLRGGITSNSYRIDLDGKGAHCELAGLAICTGSQIVDSEVLMRHNVGYCTSNQLIKYALYGSSRGAFGGKIIVADGACGTEASQTNRNLIADKDARMSARPQLEIYCDDVKCSHGSATGELDERALFYMETRGIERAEAQKMLTQAFMSDAVEAVKNEQIRDRLRHLVERRLSGEDATCQGCSTDNLTCHELGTDK